MFGFSLFLGRIHSAWSRLGSVALVAAAMLIFTGGCATTETADVADGPPKWHDQALWGRVRTGMALNSVRSILGKPTRVEGSAHKTYHFRGIVDGVGDVYGRILFYGNETMKIESPFE